MKPKRFAAPNDRAASRRGDLTIYPAEDARREAVEEKDEMSTETKWTPGPWLARDYKNKDGDIWIDCDSWRNPKTASCRGGTLATAHESGAGEGTVEANALLIAASPRLYAALDELVSIVDAAGLHGTEEARAALAAARGEQ